MIEFSFNVSTQVLEVVHQNAVEMSQDLSREESDHLDSPCDMAPEGIHLGEKVVA